MALQGIEVTGKIIKVYEPKSGVSNRTGNKWMSQNYVIEENSGGTQYPRACEFRVFGEDRINQFAIKAGDTVHVWLDINARPWNDKYITDISAYRVDHVDPNAVNQPAAAIPQAAPQQTAPQGGNQAPFPPQADGAGATDDLPF